MIRYVAALFILACGYYTFTYGKSLWKDENNVLGGMGAIIMAGIGTLIPIAYMLIKK